MVPKCTYQNALALQTAGAFDKAYEEFVSLGEYEEAVSRSEACCLAQLKKTLEAENSDNAWLDLSLKNDHTRDQAFITVASVVNNKISAGSVDFAYSLLMGKLKDYPQKFTEQGYLLAVGYLNNKNYDNGKALLEWISAAKYKDSAELLSECNYQLLLKKVAKDPKAEEALTELYDFAKKNYKDSREMMNAICSPDTVYGYLSCDTPSFTLVDQKTWRYWDGSVAFTEYKYRMTVSITNHAPIPIQGKVVLKFTAPRSVSPTTSNATETKTYSVQCVIKPKVYSYTMDYTTEWIRDYPSVIVFRSVTGDNALRVYYGK